MFVVWKAWFFFVDVPGQWHFAMNVIPFSERCSGLFELHFIVLKILSATTVPYFQGWVGEEHLNLHIYNGHHLDIIQAIRRYIIYHISYII